MPPTKGMALFDKHVNAVKSVMHVYRISVILSSAKSRIQGIVHDQKITSLVTFPFSHFIISIILMITILYQHLRQIKVGSTG